MVLCVQMVFSVKLGTVIVTLTNSPFKEGILTSHNNKQYQQKKQAT